MQFTDYLPYIYGTIVVVEVLHFLYGKYSIYRQAQVAKRRMQYAIHAAGGVYASYLSCVLTRKFVPLDDSMREQFNELFNSNVTPMAWQLINNVLKWFAEKHLNCGEQEAGKNIPVMPVCDNFYNYAQNVDTDDWIINPQRQNNVERVRPAAWNLNRRVPNIGRNRIPARAVFGVRQKINLDDVFGNMREQAADLDNLDNKNNQETQETQANESDLDSDDEICACPHCTNEFPEQEIQEEPEQKVDGLKACGCANYDDGMPGPCTYCHFCGGPYNACQCAASKATNAAPIAESPTAATPTPDIPVPASIFDNMTTSQEMAPRRRFGIVAMPVDSHPLQQPPK